MTRVSKKDRLKKCPRKPKRPGLKTGPLKDNLPNGYKEHVNACGEQGVFIPKFT